MAKKINKIIIEHVFDNDFYPDYLGTFSDEPGQFAVLHDKDGRNFNHYKYFNADNVEDMEQAEQNYKEMMRIERGEEYFIGIKATAEIATSLDNVFPAGNWLINKIHSGGLYGISSDATEAEKQKEESNQLEELKDVLLALGFTSEEIEGTEKEYKKL